ncbi:TIGR04255 family protein [Mameliella sp. AT18]|uniref:TIGR04255 family protein n=1 Tax=Mameliella sp. AT18 TaxID=3028385 RepID=UPI00237B5596|nr:TIGR04255 family protein [Mameliella sp. AT18]MDD9731670.1 TIGR04255 family protein [Mameliella sp. AT18]
MTASWLPNAYRDGKDRSVKVLITIGQPELQVNIQGRTVPWRPLQPNHAIERVRIIVALGTPLPSKFLRSVAADNDERRLALGFTSKNLRRGQQIHFQPSGVSFGGSPSELWGWDWQRLTAGNRPVETLVVENEAIVYETAEYIRWTSFLRRFEEVAGPILDKILTVVDAATMSLEYGDRFVFEGRPIDARPDFLLANISALLPENAASGGSLWHVHRGWFEELEGHKVLINQNLDAQDSKSPDRGTIRSVQVLTKTELRSRGEQLEYEVLKEKLASMHERSKEIFKSVLSEGMQAQVGIRGETNGQS